MGALLNALGAARRATAVTAAAASLLAALAAGAQSIVPAPAFNAERLSTLPRDEWITNGGTIANQRYSPLDLINRGNVAGLKGVWRTGLRSGTGPGNSAQAQILVFEGVLYVSTGDNDVFALNVDTGEVLWDYRANTDRRAGNPFGRSNRGVAIGEGRVFIGQLDAKLVALDQRTGAVLWSQDVAPWQEGYSITSAPLYYDGLVVTGVSGGVMGRRGRVTAYDAETGEQRWVFYTIPGPGELGHDTWPADGNAWQHGGAPVWQTPAVDPELGLLYFSTGNPGPVLNGAVRPGDNLFNNSIVALDARTGEYRWHFQQVHHDIWDYDSPNPIVLFEAEYGGERRSGLVQVGKTGWAYILDRATGEPLIGIEERPVPQEPRQHTAAPQPYPIGEAIVPQQIDIAPQRKPGDAELVNGGRIFTPFWTERVMVKPASLGGANWPPSSYDPERNLLFVCATDRISTYAVTLPLQPPVDNQPYFGGNMGGMPGTERGIFAALDVRTNRIAWRQEWRDHCYSGSIVTKGGLVFVGRSDGRLTALDKDNGDLLWEFTTDAGVNSTVTTFERRGRQYVVVHAGGGVFANGKRGDGIWMFSLDGTIESIRPEAPPSAAAAARAEATAAAAAPAAAGGADLDNGARLYREACLPCHGPTGEGGEGGGAALTSALTREAALGVISAGRNTMPAFGESYTGAQMRDLAAYVVERLAAGRD
jgi:alcohol dehydrogenase (cytochrome c)